MLLTDWETIRNIAITGVATYLFFIITLRLIGKRSLSQMNSFDFSVTVAIGSILASTLTNSNTSAVAGIFAFSLLLVLQYIIAKFAVHFDFFNKLIKSKPALLYYKGKYDWESMKKQRVTKDDILQEVRLQQIAFMDEVLAVLIEANGKLSVLKGSGGDNQNSTLQNVDHKFLQDVPEISSKQE